MTIYEKLTVANFVLTVTILAMLSVSLMPHLKHGMAVVRDAVLWVAMVVLVCLVLAAAWYRMRDSQSPLDAATVRSSARSAAPLDQLADR